MNLKLYAVYLTLACVYLLSNHIKTSIKLLKTGFNVQVFWTVSM